MGRATLRLTLACGNRCAFCAQEGLAAAESIDAPDIEARLTALRGDHETLTLIGGEPSTASRLHHAITHAARLGFSSIGLQTNGAGLLDDAQVDKLAAAGLTEVHLSVHGPRAEVHEYHTGTAGSFERCRVAMDLCRRRDLTVVVTTVLTRSNARVLSDMPAWLAAGGARAWSISALRTAGRAGSSFAKLTARLGLSVSHALHALDRARKLGIDGFTDGLPLCLLGPHARHALTPPTMAYAEPCDQCDARPFCAGVDAGYLARFGPGELRACAAPDATAEASPLRAAFVGVGELAPPAASALAPSGSAGLPVLDEP